MLRNRTAQISLLFIVFIALGLVLMAMVMNWNRTVQFKTQAQVAATTSASTLVSRMASYGQQQMSEYLEGKSEKCDQNGILSIIIMIIIIIVIIIIIIVAAICQQYWLCAIMAYVGSTSIVPVIVALTIALVLTIATLAIQLAYIQPMITELWNKQQQNITTVEDKFLESAIQSGLEGVVTDNETIPDLLDWNMNGKYNVPGLPGSDPTETISRFSYHYTNRLNEIENHKQSLYRFTDELKAFLKDLGMDSEKAKFSCGDPTCNELCWFHPGTAADLQQAALPNSPCYGAPGSPFNDYPYNYDALRNMSDGGSGASPLLHGNTVAELLGKERVVLPPSGGVTAVPEQGDVFRFLWSLKKAADRNYASPTHDIFTDTAKAKLSGLKSFYDPAASVSGCPEDKELSDTSSALTNRWRPGDNLFCNRNYDAGQYTAPHWSNCSYYGAGCKLTANSLVDSCSCIDSPAPAAWPVERFDQDVTILRDAWHLLHYWLDGSHMETAYDSSKDSLLDQLTGIFGGFGTIKTEMTGIHDMLLSSGVTAILETPPGFTLAGDGTTDLKAAAQRVQHFLDNYDHAMSAFSCSSAHVSTLAPDALSLCKSASHGGDDRISYLLLLMNSVDTSSDEAVIGPWVVYGWQGPASGTLRGYRHVVKVEAATPRRCRWWIMERGNQLARACGTAKFPWIKTHDKGTFERCYTMTDTDGCVKVRITRWDEDSVSRILSFVGGGELWSTLSGHPQHDGKPTQFAKDISACFGGDRVKLNGGQYYYIPNSFMINKNEDYAARYNMDCSDAVNTAVRRGFVTEVCAKYYIENDHYKLKFIPCNLACQ